MINRSVRATKEDLVVVEKAEKALKALNDVFGELQARGIAARVETFGQKTAGKVDREVVKMALTRTFAEVDILL